MALSLAGALGGVVIGLQLRPPPPATVAEAPIAGAPPAAPLAPALPAASGAPAPPAPAASADTAALSAQLAALRRMLDQEQARLEALTRARTATEAEEQARQEALARSRAAAEAQLAALQRDLAATQREASQREAAQPPPREPAPPSRREPAVLPPIAAPAPARPPRPEAAGGQPRVFVHHRAGSPNGAEAAAALLGPLREGGFEVPEVRPTPSVPSQRVVRYFYADDAAVAARLAGRLGRGWAIQDFRGFEPAPSPGTLEVWVPDR